MPGMTREGWSRERDGEVTRLKGCSQGGWVRR